MYILLYSAKKNVGDFLIFERARELVRTYRKTNDFLELPRWEPLDTHLDIVNKAEAIIWCGGPGYAPNFYPEVLPLIKNLADLKVPVVPLGIGWGVGSMSSNLDTFQFTEEAHTALSEIHLHIPYSSVRDILTEQVLKNSGVKNVVTTGCPAWYNLSKIHEDFVPPKHLKRIVMTTPAQRSNFQEAERLSKVLTKRFPTAEKFMVFHRGILPDKYSGWRDGALNSRLAMKGYLAGWCITDASYSTSKIKFYEACDLHIGYRVHAHIDFLSLRKPSILIQEDARGVGQSLTLATQDVLAGMPDTLDKLSLILNQHIDSHFETFYNSISIMKEKHVIMREFLEAF